ncbi:MAG: DUF86 domain-containing protein [Candidatus Ratteibacteria bacterium]
MKRDIRDYLNDILEECNYLMRASGELTFETFIQNEHLKKAFLKSLENIGEAVKKIPKKLKDKYSKINWRNVAGIRDILVHEYFGVNYKVIWETIKEDVPKLKDVIEEIIEKMKNRGNKSNR